MPARRGVDLMPKLLVLLTCSPRLCLPLPPMLRHTILVCLLHRWHVFVGRNFGCYVTHEESKFVYFYIGQVGICIFSTN